MFFEVKDIPGDKQVSYILLMTGDEGVALYNSWGLSDTEKKDPKAVWEKFDSHIEPTSNFRVERLNFQRLRQREDESTEDFVSRLTNQADKCKFSNKDERLIEQLIFGTKHSEVQKSLLIKDDTLSLTDAIKSCRIHDASVTHHQAFQQLQTGANTQVHAVQHGYKSDPHCLYCGYEHHRRGQSCPARDTMCRRCGQKGHWGKSRICPKRRQASSNSSRENTSQPRGGSRSRGRGRGRGRGRRGRSLSRDRQVSEVTRNDDEQARDESFFHMNYDTITINNVDKREAAYATVNIKLPDRISDDTLRVKVDTGAEGNILPLRTFRAMFPGSISEDGTPDHTYVKRRPGVKLTAYNGGNIEQYGSIEFQCGHGSSGWQTHEFFVADSSGPAILGLRSCQQLELVSLKCDSVNSSQRPTFKVTLPNLKKNFPQRFDTVGDFKGELHLTTNPEVPPKIHPNRKYAIQRKEAIKTELDRLTGMNIIVRETEPTDWVSSITFVEKANGSIRVCLDPKDLNKALTRPIHKTPTLEEVTHQFNNAKVFSKLDAKNGYWSIRLDEASSKLTTFNTPFGRYRFLRLPFGLVLSQDVFQQKMDCILEKCPGCVGIADDVAVVAATEEEHDAALLNLMKVAEEEGLSFNSEKCQIRVKEIPFFGQIYNADGVRPDPERVEAIRELPSPDTKTELQEFLGIATYMSTYVPRLSHHTAVLRELLKSDVEFEWTPSHEEAFVRVKNILCEETILAYFDPAKPSIVQVDSSSRGLGAALIQDGKAIAFASKSLSDTERRYANIEREMLAVVYGCERFHTYLYGKPFVVHSDHKPLEMIHLKNLHAAPPRLQRMLLRLQPYNVTIQYQPGNTMLLADGLSRLPGAKSHETIQLDVYVHLVHFGEAKTTELREETARDPELGPLRDIIVHGWPETQKEVPKVLKPYWSYRDELSIDDGIILKGSEQVLIPRSMQPHILEAIHKGHQGRDKCRLRAKATVYWNNINADIERVVASCEICQTHAKSQKKEPLLPKDVPPRPWHTLATDFFTLDEKEYLVITDQYSKFPFVRCMGESCNSTKLIRYLKELFGMYAIPEFLYSDNGTQFTSYEFQQFVQNWNFTHLTSSPRYAQSNGFAEKFVDIVKTTLIKAKRDKIDPDMSLLCLRTTPISEKIDSPMELLTGRKARANLPVRLCRPKHQSEVPENLQERQTKQKLAYDRTAGPELPPLYVGQQVRIQNPVDGLWAPGTVIQKCSEPRSYILGTPNGGRFRRNRRFIAECPRGTPERVKKKVRFADEMEPEPVPTIESLIPVQSESKPESPQSQKTPSREGYSRYGRRIKAPELLNL